MRIGLGLAIGLAMTGAGLAETVRLDVSGDSMIGSYETSDGAGPAVLLLHGFTGTRDELPVEGTEDFVYTRFARALAAAGMPSLRIDFRGSGESLEMPWEETTFSTQIEDAVAAVDWMARHPDLEGRQIAVIGWSQGGLVAAHLAAERPQSVSRGVTQSRDSAGGDLSDTLWCRRDGSGAVGRTLGACGLHLALGC